MQLLQMILHQTRCVWSQSKPPLLPTLSTCHGLSAGSTEYKADPSVFHELPAGFWRPFDAEAVSTLLRSLACAVQTMSGWVSSCAVKTSVVC